MPLLKSRRVLAAKQETTIGTGVTLTSGTDGIINAFDVVIDADIPYNERVAQGAFGRLAGTVGTYGGSVSFKLEGIGSGTAGTAPAWATVLLPACGMLATSNVFTPITAFASQESVTIGVYEDGAHKSLTGAMGSYSIDCEDGKTPIFTFNFKGVWQPPTDVGMFTPQFSPTIPPRFAGATFTIGSFTPLISKFTMNYGTKIEMRQDVTQTAGFISAVVTDRKVTGTLDPEQTLVAAYDAFGIWLAGTTAALTVDIGFSSGSQTGTGFAISVPVLQYDNIKEGTRNDLNISNLSYLACQNGSTVDSEVTITF